MLPKEKAEITYLMEVERSSEKFPVKKRKYAGIERKANQKNRIMKNFSNLK